MAKQTRLSKEKQKRQWLARYGHRPIRVEVISSESSPQTWKVQVTIKNPGPPSVPDDIESLDFESQERANQVADMMTGIILNYGGNVVGRPFQDPLQSQNSR
jgi:hypothetical protein